MTNEFCPRWDSNPWPPAFAASVLTARPRGPLGRERTTPRLILKHLESISHKGTNSFFTIYSILWSGMWKIICKINLKLKVLKLIKQNLMQNLDHIKLKRLDLHWLIESIPEGFWSLYPMPDGIWLGAFVGNTFKVFYELCLLSRCQLNYDNLISLKIYG